MLVKDKTDYAYISTELCSRDTGELIQHLFDHGCVIESKHPFHSTLIYDPRQEELTEALADFSEIGEIKASVIGFEVFGEDQDTPVLLLNSRDLHLEHNRLLRSGHQHTFTPFKPHLSLAYDLDKYEIQKFKLALADYAGKILTFNKPEYGVKKL